MLKRTCAYEILIEINVYKYILIFIIYNCVKWLRIYIMIKDKNYIIKIKIVEQLTLGQKYISYNILLFNVND